ncbi:hypothetical protein BVRB_1g013020 [Beta vulgaris subsp. vulgaris]|nr:hypothetical protein BVRB_1g013020 [Beta vulgaris subsp. vulgaris]
MPPVLLEKAAREEVQKLPQQTPEKQCKLKDDNLQGRTAAALEQEELRQLHQRSSSNHCSLATAVPPSSSTKNTTSQRGRFVGL